MTCAEARRQLSAPSPGHAAEIDAHVEGCAPCRGESESLKEVDRRIGRLGEVRRNAARAAFSRSPGLGRAAVQARPARASSPSSLSSQSPSQSPAVSGAPLAASAPAPSAPSAMSPSADLQGAPTIARWLLMLIVPALLAPALLWWLLHTRH